MTDNLFDNAKFGDMFLTTENKQAVFLRLSEIAILYIEGWGNVQVFRHNGKEIFNDAAHSIISKQEEPVSEDLVDATQTITYKGEVYTRCYKDKLDAFACKYPMSVPKPSKRYAKYSEVDLTIAVKEGAKWHKENLWKPADGDDLPILNREVIALLDNGKVVFAHRPPKYWDGKDIVTGKVTRHYPKTYDKGGWNIPDVKWWLDCYLPKEIEL